MQSTSSLHEAGISRGPIGADPTIVRFVERLLHDALVQQARPSVGMFVEPSASGAAAINHAIVAICADVRQRGLRPEEMLVVVKQAWSQLAPVRARHLGDRDGDVLRHVVTLAIQHYFADRDAAAGA